MRQFKTFSDLFNFTRNGSATYWGADGRLHTAGLDVPRYEYDPVTGLFRGLLIEGTTATNLLDYSEDFSQWTANTAVSVTTVPVTAPDGTGTMTQLETTADTTQNRNQIYTGGETVGTKYVFSYFIKTDQYQFARLNGLGLGGDGVVFDLVNKTFNIFTRWDTAGIIDCGNNTVRVWAVGTAGNTNGPYISFAESLNEVGTTPAGSKLHIWGAQFEEYQGVDGPSSYIPTNGASVTRAADNLPVSNIDWYDNTQGTIYWEGEVYGSGWGGIVGLDNSQYRGLVLTNAGDIQVRDYGVRTVLTTQVSNPGEYAITYGNGQMSLFKNGVKIGTTAFTGFGTYGSAINGIKLGFRVSRQYTRKCWFNPTPLTDAEAVEATS